MIAGSIRPKNKGKRRTYYYKVLACLFSLSVTSFHAIAQTAVGDSPTPFKKAQEQLQQVKARLASCQSIKSNELEDFNFKRNRYLRLISWASHLPLAASLRPSMDALRERDRLLVTKAEKFESCVPAMREFSASVDMPRDENPHVQALPDINRSITELKSNLQACQACGLGYVGEGINYSAIELLVMQQKNERKLRNALYRQLSSDRAGDLSTFDQWLITRDVVLAHITDSALKLHNSQKLIVMLEYLEKTLEPMDASNKFTDKVVDVYHQLALTLQSQTTDRRQQAALLEEKFTSLVPEHYQATTAERYTKFDVNDMARRINAMPPQERDMLVSTITDAVNKYQRLNIKKS